MRVVDLDRDMSDVIPTATTVESEFLFQRMTDATLDALPARPNAKLLDSAAGIGQDARALAARGAIAFAAEPSKRMMALAELSDDKAEPPSGTLLRVRAWSESLPFRKGSFDGVFCKGALDHFDDPGLCIQEMARVAGSDGRVVLTVANFGALGCRWARFRDRNESTPHVWGRRHYDVPSDHYTRYDLKLLKKQAGEHIIIDTEIGVSLLWGISGWARFLARFEGMSERLLHFADSIARRFPSLADVVVIAGRPRN